MNPAVIPATPCAVADITIETSNVELDETYCRKYPYVQPGKYANQVSDNGIGMDDEVKARVFELFYHEGSRQRHRLRAREVYGISSARRHIHCTGDRARDDLQITCRSLSRG